MYLVMAATLRLSAVGSLLVPVAPWVPAALAQTVPSAEPNAKAVTRCNMLVGGSPKEAEALARTVLVESELSPSNQLMALSCLMAAQQAQGKAQEAESTLQLALPLLENPDVSDISRLNGMLNTAGIYQALGRVRDALGMLERVLHLSKRMDSPNGQITALRLIATIHYVDLNDLDGCLNYFRQAIVLAERHTHPINPDDVILYYSYGYGLLLATRYDEASKVLRRAEDLARSLPDQEVTLYRILSHRGEIARATGKPTPARSLLKQALAWQEAHGDAAGQAVTLRRLARLEMNQTHPTRALLEAQRSLEIAEHARLPAEIRESLELMIQIHQALGDSERASHYRLRLYKLEGMQRDQNTAERLAALEREMASELTNTDLLRDRLTRNLALAAVCSLASAAAIFILLRRIRLRQRRLTDLIDTDSVTGLLNRQGAIKRIRALPAHESNCDVRCALLIIAFDDARMLEDTYGHRAYNSVLEQVAQHLAQACDRHDIISRWGNGQFAVVRPDTSQAAAFALAEHLRTMLARVMLELSGNNRISVTFSIGLAPYPFFPNTTTCDWSTTIQLADRAMCAARESGGTAWAGLWGQPTDANSDLDAVQRDPEAALARSQITAGGSHPIAWGP